MPNSILKTISVNLNRLKENKKVKAVDIANALDVSESTVANWLHGRKMPRAGHIQQLAIFFDVSKNEILVPYEEQIAAIEVSKEKENIFSQLTEENRRKVFEYVDLLILQQRQDNDNS